MLKILLSINYKLFLDSAEEFIKIISENDIDKNIAGFEINFDNKKNVEFEYAKGLAKLCKEYEYILNVHSKYYDNLKDTFEYLNDIESISNIYDNKINVTYHPFEKENKKECIMLTKEYFNEILNYIKTNNMNLQIGIENLNRLHGLDRLKINNVEEVIKSTNELRLTHDIGHEIIDTNEFTKLNDYLISKLTNIHIHNFKDEYDHYPIYLNDQNIKIYYEFFDYIKNTTYQGTIVLEYAADYLDGDNKVEKIKSFIKLASDFQVLMNK